MSSLNNLNLFFVVTMIFLNFLLIQFFLRKIRKKENDKGFLRGMFLYFLFILIAYIIQFLSIISGYNNDFMKFVFFNSYLSVCFFIFAPVFFIYELEIVFSNKRIIFKYHIYSILILILYFSFLIISLNNWISDYLFLQNFDLWGYNFLLIPLFYLGFIPFLLIFLIYGIQSTPRIKNLALGVIISQLTNQIVNSFSFFSITLSLNILIIGIFWSIKVISFIFLIYFLSRIYFSKILSLGTKI